MKRVYAWILYDFANSSYAVIILAVIFSKFFAQTVAGGQDGLEWQLFGLTIHIPGASLFTFIVALSMLAVAIGSPILGALADYSGRRRRYLMLGALIGIFATSMLYFSGPGTIRWTAFWFIISNIGFAGANVFYNSFLIDISSQEESGWVSGLGYAAGYLGGGLLLIINFIAFRVFPGYTEQMTFLTVSVWWLLFSIPLFRHVRDYRPLIPAGEMGGYLKIGCRRLAKTFGHLNELPQLLRFLVAFLLYNDGVETVIIMAAIFGAQVLGMDTVQLILFFLMIQGTAMLGALLFGKLADQFGHRTILLMQMGLWSLLLLWAYYLGILFEPLQEFWMLGFLAGLVMGGSQTVSRSLQRLFTPEHKSAEFFGFFAVSGKFATILGPLLYGLIIIWTNDIRSGMLVLLLFFFGGGLILFFVNEQAGIVEAISFDKHFQPASTIPPAEDNC
jgi:MFS transporter, UMF1 family